MDDYEALAITIAREVGAIMLEHFSQGALHRIKRDRTPLTDADLYINEHVLNRLSEAFPAHSLIGEEGTRLSDNSHAWVFDPIDGTVPYMRGIPTNVFSLALVVDGVPELGVVHDPYLDRMYHAVRNAGAYMNGLSIQVATNAVLADSYIDIAGQGRLKNSLLYDELRKTNTRFLTFNSTVYGHMLVACGQLVGAVYPLTKPWDCAAAKVIIEEAGGVASDFLGNDQRYDRPVKGFISSANRVIHDQLIALSEASFELHDETVN